MTKQRQRLSDRKRKVTFSDVARLAQLSDSTVSRTLRNRAPGIEVVVHSDGNMRWAG